MTEIKKKLYAIEDLVALGTQLPKVAFPKLKEAVERIDEETYTLALGLVRSRLAKFIRETEQDFNEGDERAMKKAFMRENRKHPDLLHEYRENERFLQFIENY